jgi:hypothetical protein
MPNKMNRFSTKIETLRYFNERAQEILVELELEIGRSNQAKITQALQPKIKESRDTLIRSVAQEALRDKWAKKKLVESILMISHSANVVMLDYRNRVWPYEYMSFSRRVGELWESFCGLCFQNSLKTDLVLEIPPLFSEVRMHLSNDLLRYIGGLPVAQKQKDDLNEYYKKVWLLVDAGEIKLELDMHIQVRGHHYNIDFKSGFGSNEKGNTNRLLVVASIYQNILGGTYRNLILVRSREEEGNHYLQTLKRSGLWEVLCGADAYSKICELTDINLAQWIKENVNWKEDLSAETYRHLEESNLIKYLEW